MSFAVFDTTYARNNSEILRWSSVGVAAFLTVICLVWAAIIYSKPSFKADVVASVARDAADNSDLDNIEQPEEGATMMRRMTIALFFMMTVAATFLSWYIASLHMSQNNLIALDVLNFAIVIMLGLGAYMYYKTHRKRGAARCFVGIAAVLEWVALIVLLVSPTTSGSNGVLTQSALYVPLLIATMTAATR